MISSFTLNKLMRERSPRVHSCLKRLTAGWRSSPPGVLVPPTIKRFYGRLVLVHPRFFTWDLDAADVNVPRWITQNARSGDTFLDIGANVGFFSIWGALAVGTTGKVVAFEPSSVNLGFLSYHKRINHLRHLEIVPKAISSDAEEVQFYLLNGGDSASNSLTFGKDSVPLIGESEKTSFTVAAVSLGTFCSLTGTVPNLVKIDVEGAELLVLMGAAATLEKFHPAIILAVHPFWLPDGQSVDQIFNFLSRRGYSYF